jgi:hypothetical protein
MNLLPVLVPLALVPVVVAVLLLARRARQQRTEALRGTSGAMGFAFEDKGNLEQLQARGSLPIFDRGHGKRVSNVMTGRAGGTDQEVALFDYQYTTGAGKESHTWRQTVALFPSGARRLPDLVLAPENFFHKVGQVFGYQDVDFEANPDFSSRYLLRGPDESAIRAALSPDKLSFFEHHLGWTVEVHGGTVGIYRSGKRCKPEDVREFLEDARAVLRALAAS